MFSLQNREEKWYERGSECSVSTVRVYTSLEIIFHFACGSLPNYRVPIPMSSINDHVGVPIRKSTICNNKSPFVTAHARNNRKFCMGAAYCPIPRLHYVYSFWKFRILALHTRKTIIIGPVIVYAFAPTLRRFVSSDERFYGSGYRLHHTIVSRLVIARSSMKNHSIFAIIECRANGAK